MQSPVQGPPRPREGTVALAAGQALAVRSLPTGHMRPLPRPVSSPQLEMLSKRFAKRSREFIICCTRKRQSEGGERVGTT